MGNDSMGGELKVHAFADGAAYARRIARGLGVSFAPVRLHRFPDGESLVRVAPQAGRHAVLIRTLSDPNSKILDTLFAADALRRAGASRVSLVVPYLAYMRQDKVFHPGEPISQRVIGKLLGEAFDAVLTMEPHLHRVKNLAEVIPCETSTVAVAPAVARWVKREAKGCVVVGPDAESWRFVEAIARAAGAAWIVGEKQRHGDRRVKITFARTPAANHAVIVDDIASSGVTLAEAVRELRRHGVVNVDAVVVHAVFAPGALAMVRRAGARRIVSCDTISHPTNAIRTAPLFAEALRRAR
jgi:ribose-phosphate pyrophosphokinase